MLDWIHLSRLVVFDDDGVSPYLSRQRLTPDDDRWRRFFPGSFVHWFYRGDHYRELHSHPWRWALSLILWGGYREERMTKGASGEVVITERLFKPFSVNVLRHDTFHRVTLLNLNGCLTLFIAGPKLEGPEHETWGFISRDGKTYETAKARFKRIARERMGRIAKDSGLRVVFSQTEENS